MAAVQTIPIQRHGPSGSSAEQDLLAIEDPLELRLDGHPVAVLMRTPGHDEELAAGFLRTEALVSSLSQIRKIDPRPDENRVLVFLEEDVRVDLGRLTRHLFTGSSCGLCGKATVEAIFTHSPPISGRIEVRDEVLLSAPEKLRAAQSIFDTTGGLHAAGLFSGDGELLIVREDVGRHNAVDKVIGRALMDAVPMDECFLLVSGRASFEIMQKALAARIPLVAAVSAPSSLAVEFAKGSGQGLVGFLRPPGFNRYA